jgi:hypothetical protein
LGSMVILPVYTTWRPVRPMQGGERSSHGSGRRRGGDEKGRAMMVKNVDVPRGVRQLDGPGGMWEGFKAR